jgi:hypothetical protein
LRGSSSNKLPALRTLHLRINQEVGRPVVLEVPEQAQVVEEADSADPA